MLMTSKMMLEYLGLDEEGKKIEKAIGEVLVEKKPGTLTYDVLRDFVKDPDWEKNAASTIDMAAAIARKINPGFKGEKLEKAKAKVKDMCDWNKVVGFEG
jgi:isocitrate/isopropylmalate dehydrogenase